MVRLRHVNLTGLAVVFFLLASGAHAQTQVYCGGQLAPGALHRYIEKLEYGLASGHVPRTLGPKPGAPRPSIKDWRMIHAALSAGKLYPVGWRGCILSSGKAAFDTDETGNLILRSFDPKREWEP